MENGQTNNFIMEDMHLKVTTEREKEIRSLKVKALRLLWKMPFEVETSSNEPNSRLLASLIHILEDQKSNNQTTLVTWANWFTKPLLLNQINFGILSMEYTFPLTCYIFPSHMFPICFK